MKLPALFLDRDGVINLDYGHVIRPDDFHFVDGIFDLVASATKAGFIVVIITNQSGIGRGYYSEAQFLDLMDWVIAQFSACEGRISSVYFCPFHPEHGIGDFRTESEFRKPAPGMLLQAARELNIDFARSVFIGDQLSDVQAGLAAGVATILYFGKGLCEAPAIAISSLYDAIPYLRRHES